MDHYELLGVSRDADGRAVARAFRRAARDVHPDRGGDAERFLALEEAYRVLTNPALRRVYDGELDGRAPGWDDVGWGVEVEPAPSTEDGGSEPSESGWDDVGWGDDDAADGSGDHDVREVDGAGATGCIRPMDPFVGGPVRLPDPLATPAADVPLAPASVIEWTAGLVAIALAVGASTTRLIAVRASTESGSFAGSSDAATTPVAALLWLAVAVFLHLKASRASGGETLAWLFTAVAGFVWFGAVDAVGWSGLFAASLVAGPGAVLLAVIWARMRRRRVFDPARLAALHRQSIDWRIDRHHRADEWNRVRAALLQPGRVAVVVGPAVTDAQGRLLPGRRWTFDPSTGGQVVRVVAEPLPQGSWAVLDQRGRVVATAPAWAPEAWLDAVQGVS